MNEILKPVEVGPSALKHGLTTEYITEMWYDSSCEGFSVHRLPPDETNLIAIRFLPRPDGTLEMIAEDEPSRYFVFHAQVMPEGKKSNLLAEALVLAGLVKEH